jgi:hypothetical protein
LAYVLGYWRSQQAKAKAKEAEAGGALLCRDCGDARAVEDAVGSTDGEFELLASHQYVSAEVWIWRNNVGELFLSKQPTRGRGWVKGIGKDFGRVLRRNPALKNGLTQSGTLALPGQTPTEQEGKTND